jgi:glycerophosphoryl diester phosphodiesterase
MTMQSSALGLPELIAHRGNAAEFPENTLEALASAVELGVRHVEFDVQLTADHVPVVFHDANLVRVAGRSECVHELDWRQLAGIAIGEPTRFGARFADVRPTSLAGLAEALPGWRGVTAFVEIKRSSLRRFGHEVVIDRVVAALRGVLDQCVWISFDLACVEALRRLTGARVGWVLERYDEVSLRDARAVRPDFLFADVERMPPEMSALWPGPWDWAIYEVRDLDTARRCRRLGARFVETMTVRDMVTAFQAVRQE